MSELVLYASTTAHWFVEEYEELVNALNAKDRQRFDKMKSQLKRQQLVLSRYLIQEAVFKLTDIQVSSYEIKHFTTLIINQRHTFSLSITHSKMIAAICISTRKLSLGIDVEVVKTRNFVELSSEICTPKELTALKKIKNQPSDFYQLWTLKEALAKASGTELIDLFSYDCSNIFEEASSIINLNNFVFYYETTQLKHQSKTFIGTLLIECSDSSCQSSNSAPQLTTDSNMPWNYFIRGC